MKFVFIVAIQLLVVFSLRGGIVDTPMHVYDCQWDIDSTFRPTAFLRCKTLLADSDDLVWHIQRNGVIYQDADSLKRLFRYSIDVNVFNNKILSNSGEITHLFPSCHLLGNNHFSNNLFIPDVYLNGIEFGTLHARGTNTSFRANVFKNVYISGCDFSGVSFSDNKLLYAPNIHNLDGSVLGVINCRFQGEAIFGGNTSLRPAFYSFVNDTFSHGEFFMSDMPNPFYRDKWVMISDARFANCSFDCNMRYDGIFSTIIFINCSNSPDHPLTEFVVDTLVLDNCKKMYIDFNTLIPRLKDMHRQMILEISQCDFDNWNFQYNDETPIQIVVPYKGTKDYGVSVYTKLLKKFDQEGYKDSYERVAKELYVYKHSWFWNMVNYLYWDFGYSFTRIIFWTFLIIAGFSLLNLRYWQAIQHTYKLDPETDIPLIPIDTASENNISKYLRYKSIGLSFWNFFYVFIFTCMVMFSFRVDRSRFRFESKVGLCLYLIEFLFGIGTIYFLLNVAVKIIA